MVQGTSRRPRCIPVAFVVLLPGRRPAAGLADVLPLGRVVIERLQGVLGRTPVVESEHWAPP